MSGGAFDYNQYWLDDWAKQIEPENPLLAEQMRDMCKLLNRYDYYLCGDIGEEEIEKAWTKYRDKWIKMDTERIETMMFEKCLEMVDSMIKGYRKDEE